MSKSNISKEELYLNDLRQIIECRSHDFRRDCYYCLSAKYNPYDCTLIDGDASEFESLILNAKRTTGTVFPDFISTGGFLEHFEVSASHENKKGSMYRQDAAIQDEKLAKREADIESEISKSYDGTVQIHAIDPVWSKGVDESYENLVKSFHKNWEKHIDSLNKSQFPPEYVGIFLIDVKTVGLKMYEKILSIDEFSYNDDWTVHCGFIHELRYRLYNGEYSLVRDKSLLQYMYDFRQKIKYVVFRNCKHYEIINVNNIPHLLKFLTYEFDIRGCACINVRSAVCMTVPGEYVENQEVHNNENPS